MVNVALKIVLAPVLVVQAVATRKRAPSLPEAEGAREGRVGAGDGGRGGAFRLLIAGDSSAAGVGVARQDQALSGYLSRALQRLLARPVQWSLHAKSGFTTQQVFQLLREQKLPAADVAVVVTGVNDVIEQVSLRRVLAQRAAMADWLLAEHGVAHVVFAPLPPVEHFPLLPSPLRNVMGADAHRHDTAVARWAATRSDVSHAVIDVELGPESMAADGFHPGEPVYRTCGEALAAHISNLPLAATEKHA